MATINDIKKVLEEQKTEIENLYGKVVVANDYPSPNEIKAGIKSIPSVDLTGANATEADVLQGKTFYSGTPELRTGTAVIDVNMINDLFMTNYGVQTNENQLYYTFPEGVTTVRKYAFYENANKVRIRFTPDIKKIDEYAFHNAKNFSFENFEVMPLETISSFGFAYCNVEAFNATQLTDSIKVIGSSAFLDSCGEGLSYRFPDSLQTLGPAVYKKNSRTLAENLDVSNLSVTTLPAHLFYYLAFNCDLVVPSSVRNIDSYFNYGGSFKNVVFPSGLKNIYTCAFGTYNSDALSNHYISTITFLGETPPSISSDAFSVQDITNGVKVYVPDNAIEAYKAKNNFSMFGDQIYPMSQKE